MRFKGFKIGKSKEKDKNGSPKATGTTSGQKAKGEKERRGKTDNLKQTAQPSNQLSDIIDTLEVNKDASAVPHGPIGELSVEPEDKLTGVDSHTDEEESATHKEDSGDVKLVEVAAESATSPKVEAITLPKEEKKGKSEDTDESINKLFSTEEEEENPLANLIRSLPDVTADELIEDLNEIKVIIKDWQKK